MSRALSFKEAAGLAQAANHPEVGGFTVEGFGAHPADTPESAEGKHLVGRPEYGDNSIATPMQPRHILEYTTKHETELSKPDSFLGGWNPHDGGPASLDLPQAYDRTTQGGAHAAYDATVRGEREIGELDTGGNYVGSATPGALADSINPAGGTAALHQSWKLLRASKGRR